MEFRVLGPLEVVDGERPLTLGGTKQRVVLAYLCLHANDVVSTEQLIDVVWGDDPPETATHTLHVYISQLRKVLRAANDGASAELATEGRGYVLRLASGGLDLDRFLASTGSGREALADGRPERASAELRVALAIWRGSPLSDLPYGSIPEHEIARLEELRLGATEDLMDAELSSGHHAEIVGELHRSVASHPLRERLRGQQMLALYRSGRQAEALQTYRDFQGTLAEELGIDPGPALRDLERRILQQDPELDRLEVAETGLAPGEEAGPDDALVAPTEPSPVARRRRVTAAGVAVGGVAAIVVLVVALLARDDAEAPQAVGPNGVGRLDPSTGALVSSVPTTGSGPGPIAWLDGSVWVANVLSGTVARIDPETERVARSVPTGGAPTAIAAGEGAVWALNGLDGEVVAIDPRSSEVRARIAVPDGSGGIAVGAGFVWVTNSVDVTVTKINPRSDEVVGTIRLGPSGSGRPAAIGVGVDAVWVCDELAPAMWKIDAATDEVVANPGLRAPATAIAVAPDGLVWIASYDEDLVSRMDPSTLQVTTFDPGRGPVALDVGGDHVWIVLAREGSITSMATASGSIISTTSVGSDPRGVALGGGAVWVSRAA